MARQNLRPPQPPRLAQWATALFLPGDLAESVLGDLQEEFSDFTVKSGPGFARDWYRRQALKIILHALVDAFRGAPPLMLISVIGGLWAVGFGTRWSLHATRIILDAHRVYEFDPGAYLFWLKFPAEIGRVILCSGIGAVVALVAKRREMPAAITLAFAQMSMFSAGAIVLIVHGRHWVDWFVVMAPWNLLSCIATVVGAAVVQTVRRSDAIKTRLPSLH
ncbi:MAG: permease prefix domain 2-containing transporter [Bryobacteraceae bacterium]